MPIYEYHCSKCGEFEAMQKMSDKPLAQCPTCRRKVTKLISSTTFHLKGSGWYITDYARKSEGGGANKKKSETPAASEASTSESTDKPSKAEKSEKAGTSPKSKKAAVA